MKRVICVFSISIILFLCSCEEIIHFYSIDKSNSLTVITKDTLRYVIPGIVNDIPEEGYAKFDVSNVTDLGDGIWICWEDDLKWDLTIDKAKILANDLNSSSYTLNTSLPKDERGIPTEIKYRQGNCSVFDFHTMKLSPNQGSIVEIK